MDYTIGSINFNDLKDDDYYRLNNFLSENTCLIAGYSPNSLFAWNRVFDYGWTFLSDKTLLIACCRCIEDGCSLLRPIGGFPHEDQKLLLENIQMEEKTLKILAVSDYFIDQNPEFLKHFTITEDRNQSNYVYSTSDLAELPGGKYKKKRNHIHQAENSYIWTVEIMKEHHIRECIDFLAETDLEIQNYSPDDTVIMSAGMMNERIAMLYSLKNFSRPGNHGVIIRIDGKISAISIYELIHFQGETMAQIHFEKAFRSRKGLYQVINHETAKIIHGMGIKKINREEDLGDPGLRQAKQSYYPVEMIRAWNLESIKNQEPS